MTENSLRSISPDSITGMIFGLEGVRNTVVLLNGPMGCRFYHSTTSQFLSIKPLLYLPVAEGGEKVPVDYNYLNDWFFRQGRVPCTYLDGYDYVYGTKEKVREALRFIRKNVDFDVIGIINSPGAALIGDNLLELAQEELGGARAVMLESSGYSTSIEEGISDASLALLKQVGLPLWRERKPEKKDRKTVNLLGVSIWHRYRRGDVEELTRLFSLCGIGVNAVCCADLSLEQLASLPDADLNVVIYPETGLESARFMEEACGVPCYLCSLPPVGFSATEKMFREICGLLGVSPDPVLEDSARSRALAWYHVSQIDRSYGKPKGVKFCVSSFPSLDAAYTSFLRDYLAMEPSPAEEAELVYSNANLISELMLKNRTFCGIEISLPGMGYTDVVDKTHLGLRGALFLIEQTLNGLMSRL